MAIVKCSNLFLLIVVVHSVTCNVVRISDHREKRSGTPQSDKSVENVQSTKSSTGVEETTEVMDKSEKIEPKSDIPTDIQIPVAVVYETTATPSKRVGHARTGRFRKLRRLHENRTFESRLEESLAKRNESTRFKSRNVKDAVTKATDDMTTPKTEKSNKNIKEKDPVVPILDSDNHVYSHTGSFHYSYESGDGTVAFERGEMNNDGDKPKGSVEGGFSYTDKEGNDFSLSYTADETGYHPTGAHLPTPPPIPPAIARALKYLATKPTEKSVTYSYIDYV